MEANVSLYSNRYFETCTINVAGGTGTSQRWFNQAFDIDSEAAGAGTSQGVPKARNNQAFIAAYAGTLANRG